MTIQEPVKSERRLRQLEMARIIIGVAVIAAVLAVILCGVSAFAKGRDAWLAMRLPLIIAVFLMWEFARSAKAVTALQAICRR